MFNAAFNTEESILRCRHRWFQQLPETGAALECIMEEIVRLANACGVALSEADIRALDGYFDPYPGDGLCSMAQDLQAGRPTEIDMLIGEALELGRSRGVELPVCRFVYHLVKAMEQANACGLEVFAVRKSGGTAEAVPPLFRVRRRIPPEKVWKESAAGLLQSPEKPYIMLSSTELCRPDPRRVRPLEQ